MSLLLVLEGAQARSERDTAREEIVRLRAEMGAALVEVRAEVERLRGELDTAWMATGSPVRGLGVSLAEVIEDLEVDRGALRALHKDMTSQAHRLRAVLEPTAENLGALAMCTISFSRLDVDRILAALRARAGQS